MYYRSFDSRVVIRYRAANPVKGLQALALVDWRGVGRTDMFLTIADVQYLSGLDLEDLGDCLRVMDEDAAAFANALPGVLADHEAAEADSGKSAA